MVKNDKKAGPTIARKRCSGCQEYFPDVSGGFNCHWTRAKHALVCQTVVRSGQKCGAIFGDRLEYYGHHRHQHGAPALAVPIYKPSPRLCSPRWRDPHSGLDIFKMPVIGLAAADDVPSNPQPDLVLSLKPPEVAPPEEDNDSRDDPGRDDPGGMTLLLHLQYLRGKQRQQLVSYPLSPTSELSFCFERRSPGPCAGHPAGRAGCHSRQGICLASSIIITAARSGQRSQQSYNEHRQNSSRHNGLRQGHHCWRAL